jgi:putative DNA primase/helicase
MHLLHKLYAKSSHSSSANLRLAHIDVPKTFDEVDITVPPGASGEIRTLCPNCSASRRKSLDKCLSVNASEGIWHCHHCGWSGRLRHPDYRLPRLMPRASMARSTPPDDIDRRRRQLQAVWRQARPITADDPASLYLQRRGIWQTPAPNVLKFHPALHYYDAEQAIRPTQHPALIAAIQGPDGRVVSLHRIYLTGDGHKANVSSPKKFMRPVTTIMGAAVRLDAPGAELVVSEGLETALAVRLTSGLPVWAALSASGMENLLIPDYVQLVVIAADNDAHGKGQASARKLATRLMYCGRRVKILVPPFPGDWADSLDNTQGD